MTQKREICRYMKYIGDGCYEATCGLISCFSCALRNGVHASAKRHNLEVVYPPVSLSSLIISSSIEVIKQ